MNKLRVLSQMKSALGVLNKSVSLQQSSVRTAYVYTPDWLPGDRPKDKEEALKAAKKYNMLPEEYKPAPDDGFAQGDYPDIERVHYDNKDPFYPYDYPQFRHNYGEPCPDDFTITNGAFFNADADFEKRIPVWKQLVKITLYLGSFSFVIWFFMLKYRYYFPKFDAPLYKKGVTHYGYHQK